MRSLPVVCTFSLCLGLTAALGAQTAAAAAPTPADKLQQLLQVDEPGAQMRGLVAFVQQYPKDPDLDQAYNALIADATQLNDDAGVLLYNEKLEDLDPNDLGQRIKVLNLLLLETDAANRQRALKEAGLFTAMVEAKAKETPPAEMGAARWRLNLARLRSVAGLFQGTAEQALGQWAGAEQELVHSLEQSQSEEAAEHLATVYVAEGKTAQAVNSFALALALPGQTIAGRARLRAQAGALYAGLHGGSQRGFGDLILERFDDVAARDADEQAEMAADQHTSANTGVTSARGFTLTSLDGATHTLGEVAGKVVVLDFWATWCGPCKVQHPLIAALRKQYATNHDVIFIAVNEDEDRSRVAPFLAAQGWETTTWLDAGLGGFLGVDSLPTTLILDPGGAVAYRQAGFVPATFPAELGGAIAAALARGFPAPGPG